MQVYELYTNSQRLHILLNYVSVFFLHVLDIQYSLQFPQNGQATSLHLLFVVLDKYKYSQALTSQSPPARIPTYLFKYVLNQNFGSMTY